MESRLNFLYCYAHLAADRDKQIKSSMVDMPLKIRAREQMFISMFGLLPIQIRP